MASQLDIDDAHVGEHQDSADKDDFPLLAQPRDSDVAAFKQAQHRLHSAVGVLFTVSIVLGIVAIITVVVRQTLEFFSYDDKDHGWGSRGYGYRDFPIILISLVSIVFAVLNRTRLRMHRKPLPPLVNAAVLTGVLITNCVVGFGMVPWKNSGDTACAARLPEMTPETPLYEFYVAWCKKILLYSRVRMLDMVVVDTHAIVNIALLFLSLGLFYCAKRISGEGLLTTELVVVRQLGNQVSESWTKARQWWSRTSQGWRPISSSAGNEL